MYSARKTGSALIVILSCFGTLSVATAFEPIEFEDIYFAIGRPMSGEDIEQSLESETHTSLAGALDVHQALEQALDVLNRNPKLHVLIKGYADGGECSRTDCRDLSNRRAKAVSEWLVERGIAPARIDGIKGFGAMNPRARSDNPALRWLNRRVEIEVEHDSHRPDRQR